MPSPFYLRHINIYLIDSCFQTFDRFHELRNLARLFRLGISNGRSFYRYKAPSSVLAGLHRHNELTHSKLKPVKNISKISSSLQNLLKVADLIRGSPAEQNKFIKIQIKVETLEFWITIHSSLPLGILWE